ncbi:MFS transporter [Streptomyces sp. NPDC005125]
MPTRTVKGARTSLFVIFALHGMVFGTWVSRITWVTEQLQLEPAEFGVAATGTALGAVLSMPLAGRLANRSRHSVLLPLILSTLCLTLLLPALASDLAMLFAALLFLGVWTGMFEVATTAQALLVERHQGSTIMSSLHATMAIGTLVGSGFGAVAAHTGLDARIHFAAVAVILFPWAWVVRRNFLEMPPSSGQPIRRLRLPTRPLLLISLIAGCAEFVESAAHHWGALYLTTVLHTGPGAAVSGSIALFCAIAVGRLAGDRVLQRLGTVRSMQVCGAVAGFGGLLIVFAWSTAGAIVGFALLGLGIAVVLPTMCSEAGRMAHRLGGPVSQIYTIGWLAALVEPSLVGTVADHASLSVAFAGVTALCLVIAVSAFRLRPKRPQKNQEAP